MNKVETLNTIENLISMYDKSCSPGWYIQELEKVYKYVLDEPLKEAKEEIEVKALSPAGMTADEMCEIFVKNYPEIFNYWYKECNLIFKANHDPLYCQPDEDRKYWQNDEMNFARCILYDCDREFAKKVGKILVAATE